MDNPLGDRSLPRRTLTMLVVGDLTCVVLATALGFATHQELGAIAGARFLATLIPFSVSWFAASLLVRAYGREGRRWQRTGRAVASVVLAAPLGAVWRGAWLGSAVLPVFVLVMGSVVGVLVFVWRTAAEFVIGHRRPV